MDPSSLKSGLKQARQEAEAAFKDGSIFLEKYERFDKSGLEATVEAKANDVTLTLEPAPGKGKWSEGMGSSLRVGVAAALELAPKLQGLIIALADQPGLPPAHLKKMIRAFLTGAHTIVASQAGPDRVPPVLFGREWFPRLLALSGDTGARALLQAHFADTQPVPLATNTDLDTPEDYARYTRATGRVWMASAPAYLCP